MKNVLLLCLSPLKETPNVSDYWCSVNEENSVELKGVMTNEAPAKEVISRLMTEGNRLDKIVMICSDAVRGPVSLSDSGSENMRNYLSDMEGFLSQSMEDCLKDTHTGFYRQLVDAYVKRTDGNDIYRDSPIEYVQIEIADFTEDDGVSKAVIEAADKAVDFDDGDSDIRLFIDFNGGQRYVAFMILAIANLLKIRHVRIGQVLTMNYENKVDNRVSIQDMKPVFSSFDLVSGINEYVNYGRIKTLKKYFRGAKEKKILEEMERFSNNLQLCRTGLVMNDRKGLKEMLENYAPSSDTTYTQLFSYVLGDILAAYGALLTGDLPDVIIWCVEKDYIQQALTFATEEMPGYFWNQCILKASDEERDRYNDFLDFLHGKDAQRKYKDLHERYRKQHEEGSSKYAYEWMVNYLPHIHKYRGSLRNDGIDILADDPPVKERNQIVREFNVAKNYSMRELKVEWMNGTDALQNVAVDASRFIYQLQGHSDGNGSYPPRADSKMNTDEKKRRLFEILILYLLLKKQRNLTNHADGENEENAWTYKQLRTGLKVLAEALINEEKEQK